MSPTVDPRDLVVLDRSPAVRRQPRFEGVYAVFWRGKGYLRRCQRAGEALVLVSEQETGQDDPPPRLEPGSRRFSHVVRGRVVWLMRRLPAKAEDDYEV